MRIQKISKLFSLAMACCLLLSCFAFTASADNTKVTPSQESYTVSVKDIYSAVYISNKTSIGTEVGTEYYMTYTVKTAKWKGDSVHQNGIIGTNVPTVAFPYTTPENGKGGYMNFDRNEALLVEGNTYFLKCTITRYGYDYVIGWANGGNSRYITFTDKAGDVTSDLGYFGMWFDFAYDYFELELIKVHCYDKYGNDLGVQTNRADGATVYVDTPMQKDTEVEHSYDVKVTDKVIMHIGNEFIPTSDKVYMEYTVKSGNEARMEQVGLVLTDAIYLGFPYVNGYMSYNQYSRSLENMTPGPLLEEGASYIICFERLEDRLKTTAQKTKDGKTTVVEFKVEFGDYIKSQNYFGMWFSGIIEHPNSYELVDFKCYDSNKKNLGVWCNQGAEITHYGPLENYEELDGVFYNEKDGTFVELYNDKTAAVVAADGTRKEGVWVISDAMVMTLTANAEEYSYQYFYNFIEDSAGNIWNRMKDFTVTFDTGNGSAVNAQKIGYGQGYRAAKPADPTLEGNTFVCWCTSDGEKFNFDSVIDRSITLYAKWQNTEYQKIAGADKAGSSALLIIIGTATLLAGIVVAVALIIRGKKYAKVK